MVTLSSRLPDRTTRPSIPAGSPGGDDLEHPTTRYRFDGRWIAAAIVAAFAAGLAWSLASAPAYVVWNNVGVFPLERRFEDLHLFVAAQQTLASGQNVFSEMTLDRWGRAFNYPVLWLTFMRFSAAAVPFLGAGMIAAWFVALWIACGRLCAGHGWIVGILSCSPAVALALERANTDVIIFCLVVASIALLHRGRTAAAWTGLTVATTLKLFPLFAFGCFLRLGWRRAGPWLAATAMATGILGAIQFEEIQGVLRETPKGGIFSYGAVVWVEVASILFEMDTGISDAFGGYRAMSMLCAALLVAVAFVAGARHPPISTEPDRVERTLDYFRAGASVFLATFLCGSHFVYRLIFLLLCVPWLACKNDSDDRALIWSRRAGLGLLAVGLWSNPYWSMNWYYIRELALWSLAGVLAWLMGRMLPAGFPGDRRRRWQSGAVPSTTA